MALQAEATASASASNSRRAGRPGRGGCPGYLRYLAWILVFWSMQVVQARLFTRGRARGDTQARAVPGGPADVRDLALSINFLADENDRVQEAERERARLLAEVRQAAIRIRKHLRGEAIIREAVTAIHEYLDAAQIAKSWSTGTRSNWTGCWSTSCRTP